MNEVIEVTKMKYSFKYFALNTLNFFNFFSFTEIKSYQADYKQS